jgi:hypothetical protein
MRTTIILNDKLAVAAKRLAAARNTTLSEIINEALRARLAQPPASSPTRSFKMPVYQGEGRRVDSTPGELARLNEDDEFEPFRS